MQGKEKGISIHALREEGDDIIAAYKDAYDISIHALREEGDRRLHLLPHVLRISIHALREEGDAGLERQDARPDPISIHALREEGDFSLSGVTFVHFDFYPRPPRGGRRDFHESQIFVIEISIHALREEGDTASG